MLTRAVAGARACREAGQEALRAAGAEAQQVGDLKRPVTNQTGIAA